jgi:hypothetical protein
MKKLINFISVWRVTEQPEGQFQALLHCEVTPQIRLLEKIRKQALPIERLR